MSAPYIYIYVFYKKSQILCGPVIRDKGFSVIFLTFPFTIKVCREIFFWWFLPPFWIFSSWDNNFLHGFSYRGNHISWYCFLIFFLLCIFIETYPTEVLIYMALIVEVEEGLCLFVFPIPTVLFLVTIFPVVRAGILVLALYVG